MLLCSLVRVIGVGLLFTLGCNEFFGLKQTQLEFPDAAPLIDAIGCSGQTFSGLTDFPFTPAMPASEPTLSGDLTEVWFDQPNGAGGHAQIFYATGPAGGPYTGTNAAPFIDNSGVTESYGAALTEDGLHLAFIRAGNAYEVSRAATTAMFSTTPSPLGSLDAVDSISLSRDGTVAYISRAGEIYSATRPLLMDDFMPAVDLGVAGHNPTISPDELELFYDTTADPSGNVMRRVRPTVHDPFGAPELIQTGAYEPSITFDSRMLLVVQFSTPVVKQMTRSCP